MGERSVRGRGSNCPKIDVGWVVDVREAVWLSRKR